MTKLRKPVAYGVLLSIFIIGGMVAYNSLLSGAVSSTGYNINVYTQGKLVSGWQDWSWAAHDMSSTDRDFQNFPSLRADLSAWKGVFLYHAPFLTNGCNALSFWINGGLSGGQKITVNLVDVRKKFLPNVNLSKYVTDSFVHAGKWDYVVIPLTSLHGYRQSISGVVFQANTAAKQYPVYFADIRFVGPGAQVSKGCTVVINTSEDRHQISPYVYGMASAPAEYLQDLKLGSNRWGGNPSSTYNWTKGNCWNAGRDWGFRNGNYGHNSPADRRPSGVADNFISTNKAWGVATVLTIPTIGFVARDDNNNTRSIDVPAQGGVPISSGSDAIKGYDPSYNQMKVYVRSYPRKNGPFQFPPDLSDNAVYQDEWVAHLVHTFGNAAHGGVKFYEMDNEPDLWDVTHTDIHPVRVGYDDLLSNFLAYATAIKNVDPSCMVTGPVSWGWTGYFYSARDRNNWVARPDRKAHGNMPLIPWFLQAVHKHDMQMGKRTLDVLDIHFYPQANGVYQGKTDPATDALRLRSVRALWDPTYVDESWINEPVMLIPRMQRWISKYYPGTKLGLTEWNWGADKTMNGGLAIADCLGVFGKENLYLANYWATPAKDSPGYFAFKMYRNIDDKAGGFGDISVKCVSSKPNDVCAYSSVDSSTGAVATMLINQDPNKNQDVSLRMENQTKLKHAHVWLYGSSDTSHIIDVGEMSFSGKTLRIIVPAYSMMLVRMSK